MRIRIRNTAANSCTLSNIMEVFCAMPQIFKFLFVFNFRDTRTVGEYAPGFKGDPGDPEDVKKFLIYYFLSSRRCVITGSLLCTPLVVQSTAFLLKKPLLWPVGISWGAMTIFLFFLTINQECPFISVLLIFCIYKNEAKIIFLPFFCRLSEKPLYHHFTIAVDTNNIRKDEHNSVLQNTFFKNVFPQMTV